MKRLQLTVFAAALALVTTGATAGNSNPDPVRPEPGVVEGDSSTEATVAGAWDGVTESHYVHWLAAGDRIARAEKLGCDHGRTPGLFVLALGRQRHDGAQAFAPKGRHFDRDHIVETAAAVASGIVRCAENLDDNKWTMVLATSNYNLYDTAQAADFAQQWSALVKAARRSITHPQISVVAGNDIEPGWGGPEAATVWVDAFIDTGEPLVVNASADGCPASGAPDHSRRCANGWTVGQLAGVTWKADQSSALPQIYRTDGVQAGQWALLADVATRLGYTPDFAGVMTQLQACTDVGLDQCPRLDNPPADGLAQMRSHLAERGVNVDVPGVTDVGWHHYRT